MFQIKSDYIRRLTFASKLFPKINSSSDLNVNRLKSISVDNGDAKQFDGELFCGGRSKNKDLLSFFGFISTCPANCSTFAQLTTFRRSLKKLINLVERELESIDAQEVLMPTLLPEKLWLQSKRLERQKDALDNVFKIAHHRANDDDEVRLLLGPTHEETVTRMISSFDYIHENELPLLLYQTSQKFRYEPNPRFGLLRSNEFLMNDLYSFDANKDAAIRTYDKVTEVYQRIFKMLDLDCLKIRSETGSIGGDFSHEYQLSVSSGEDTIIRCNRCHNVYNIELQSQKLDNECISCGSRDLNKHKALELGHTFLLSDIYSKPFDAKYTSQDNKRVHFNMGCYGLGLTRILAAGIDLFSIVPGIDEGENLIQLRWPSNVEPFKVGLVAPAKRSKQFLNGSSDFIERLSNRILSSTNNIDLIVEDRDKESLVKRLHRLQSIGVPNIIVVGQKFLQDQPQVEFLKLQQDKKAYEQFWFSEDQVCDFVKVVDTV